MTIRYQISTWRSSIAAEASDYATRQRWNNAMSETWRQIYAMVEADGGLDTPRGWRLWRDFHEFERQTSADFLAGQRYASRDFVLSEDQAGKLAHVRIVAIKEG